MMSFALERNVSGLVPKASTSSRNIATNLRVRSPQHTCTTRRHALRQTAVWAAAAKVEEEEDVDDLEDEQEAVDAATQAPGTATPEDSSLENSDYILNFLWMDKNIAVAVDQLFSKEQRSPVTEYFFWPRKDAWEELKVALEAKPWIPARDKVLLLNRTTEVINFWQTEGDKPSLQQAQDSFPDCVFKGS